MKNSKRKLIIIGTTLLSLNLFSQDYVYNGISNVKATVGLNKDNNNAEKISHWTFTNKNVKGLYIKYADVASGGVATFDANLGQRDFLGDPKGYKPFDENYDKNLWKNAINITGNIYKTSENLGSSYYNKTYSTGQYYFEITINGSPVYDQLGFSNNTNLRLGSFQEDFGLSAIGTYDHRTLLSENGAMKAATYSSEKILSGDTVQVWVDFDTGNVLFKELGVPIENYNTISIND